MRNLCRAIALALGVAFSAVVPLAAAAVAHPTEAQTIKAARIVDAAHPIIRNCKSATCINVAMWNTYSAVRTFSNGMTWMAAANCPAQAPFARATARYLKAATTSHAMPQSLGVAREAVSAINAFAVTIDGLGDCALR